MPAIFWGVLTHFLPRDLIGVIDDATRVELLTFTNNYLAALGLLYAIYLGMTFQTAIDRLHDLQRAISREASSLQSVCELSLTLSRPTAEHRARLHTTLRNYVDYVLARELNDSVRRIKLTQKSSFSVVAELYSLFGVFKELASNGVDDSVDLRTLDALHDEVRDLVRARSERVSLTNTRLAMVHWITLMLISILVVLGVVVNQVPAAQYVTLTLSAAIGMVVPLSFLVVSDMSQPFGGAWSVSDEPLRGVREHVMPRLLVLVGTAEPGSAEAQSKGLAEVSEVMSGVGRMVV